MPSKEKLLNKLLQKPSPANFTVQELDALMSKCGCSKFAGGRGSGLRYIHVSGAVLTFDSPHPGKELYRYQIKKTIDFLKRIEELTE